MVFFTAGAFFLVTPVGLLPLVAGVLLAVVLALVLGLVTFLVVVVFSSTTGKICKLSASGHHNSLIYRQNVLLAWSCQWLRGSLWPLLLSA